MKFPKESNANVIVKLEDVKEAYNKILNYIIQTENTKVELRKRLERSIDRCKRIEQYGSKNAPVADAFVNGEACLASELLTEMFSE